MKAELCTREGSDCFDEPAAPAAHGHSARFASAAGNQTVQRMIQTRSLSLSSPQDPFEHEAIRVSEELDGGQPHACAGGTACPRCAGKVMLKTAEGAPAGRDVPAGVASSVDGLEGGGTPLPSGVRADYESKFGYDLSAVRVHTGPAASRLTRNLNAVAFTNGRNVVFADGAFNPSTRDGRKLLGHELTHVVQQGGGIAGHGMVQRTIGDNHDLKSPRFAGDPVLEACFDNERVLATGHQGPAVEKVQQALVDAGFALPQFGVDGIFGSETRRAVTEFQISAGLSMDGIVGTETIGRLDELPSCPGNHENHVQFASAAASGVGAQLCYGVGGGGGGGGGGTGCNPKQLCGGSPLFGLVKKHGGTFAVCKIDIRKFNSGPPDVGPLLTPPMVLKGIPASHILFDTGGVTGPTWDIEAVPDACLPDNVPDEDWDVGFVQTVENLELNAEYTLDWSAARAVPVRARDAIPDDTPSPWINPAGVFQQGELLSRPVKFGTSAPSLVDQPMATFPIALPHNDPEVVPCAVIHKIELSGLFTVWLVVKLLGSDDLIFLAHTTISLSQLGQRDLKDHAKFKLSWKSSLGGGAHSIGPFAGGKGAKDPEVGRPVANEFFRILLPFFGQPCPLKLPKGGS